MLANESPVVNGLVLGEGEGESLRTEFGFGGGDCGGHVAGFAVCENADGGFAVGSVGDWYAVVCTWICISDKVE